MARTVAVIAKVGLLEHRGKVRTKEGVFEVVRGADGWYTVGGPAADGPTVRDLLLSVAPKAVQDATKRLDDAELAMMERDDEPTQLRYAQALSEYSEAGGYDAEVHWDECCVTALGRPYDLTRWREVNTLSGGQQAQLALTLALARRPRLLASRARSWPPRGPR